MRAGASKNGILNKQEFQADENWRGSFYELSLELGPAGDDAAAGRAIESLWSYPLLEGPWNDRSEFSSIPGSIVLSGEASAVYGCLLGPADADLGCVMWLIRVAGESDFLDLAIPTAMLERVYRVAYPLDYETNPWLRGLDDVLVGVATTVFASVPFQLGLLGEEAGGVTTARELSASDCERGGVLVPEATWLKLAPARTPISISPGLIYAPFLGPHITYDG